jgi:hypothetical protein
MPPQVNATITATTEASAAAGDRDDWDDPGVEPAGGGAPKWAGNVPAYYREKVDRVTDGGTINILTRRTLYIDALQFHAMALDTNDIVTFTWRGAERTGKAIAVVVADLPALARVSSVRVELEPI